MEAGAVANEVGIDPRRFVECRLDATNVCDLTADVEVEQLEAVSHPPFLEQFQGAQDLAHGQAELRAMPARRLPSSRTTGRQFDSHADCRADPKLFGIVEDQFQFRELFDNDEDLPSDLLGKKGRFDEPIVFESVADNGNVVVGHGDDGEQFRFAARLETVSVRTPELHDFFHHLPLLIYLNRIQAAVLASVVVLVDGPGKGIANLGQAIFQNVRKAEQDGGMDSTRIRDDRPIA